MTAPRRSIFIDVDGTITDHDGAVEPSTAQALGAARARGHLVYLCTGRAAGDIPAAVSRIPVDGQVTNGGAFAEDGPEQVLAAPMPRPEAEHMQRVFRELGLPYAPQTDREVFASPGLPERYRELLATVRERREAERARQGLPPDPEGVPERRFAPVAESDLTGLAKGIFALLEEDTLDRVRERLGERYLVVPGSMPMPTGGSGEASLLGTDKGHGIRAILEHRGLDAADAVGIGDSWNDVEMFDAVGTSVVMSQAPAPLRERADLVTDAVGAGGVHAALLRLGLIGEP